AVDSEIRVYDKLFTVKDPDASDLDYHELINQDSLQVIKNAKLEPWLLEEGQDSDFQFIRQGYFIQDNKDSTPEKPVFNRAVSLRETYKPE
ncbi:MAG: glutamine--tRNA ligase, partial [Clostridiaceae bacterium]|nr:glutamine--tRNA ligase [Clostridiaceae bacterium]